MTSHQWKPSNRGQRVQAKPLAKALDCYLEGNAARAIDLVAGRVRALLHADITGKWGEAEFLQADLMRDTGLATGKDIYVARKQARLAGTAAQGSA